ncbi:MAG: flavoprotein, partial [Candidatus Micrarchaeota archaeon]|nr:flavoprotein [Candidatus Micrarchaeota archaeon]
MRFSGKTILLGVTGSIAAYKAMELCRSLKKEGANVQVILSQGAKNFVSALSFQAVSGRPVLENQFPANRTKPGTGMRHIDLGEAD